METTYRVIQIDGAEQTVTVDMPKDPGYDALHTIVTPLLNGAYLERVRVLHNGVYTDMFVDEEGMLKGLPRNEKATAIYRANWLKHNPKEKPENLPPIYGPAVLFERAVWF